MKRMMEAAAAAAEAKGGNPRSVKEKNKGVSDLLKDQVQVNSCK